MNDRRVLAHRINNLLHALLFLGGMAGLLALLGWVVAGGAGLALGLGFSLLLALVAPRLSPAMILRMYRARPILPHEVPGLHALVEALSRRADLPASPPLFYVPSEMMNAFSLGSRAEAAMALTDGLLRNLSGREITGVLAHEISHIRHNDMWIMALGDTISRVVGILALVGQLLVLVSLPVLLFGDGRFPWFALLLLLAAPTVSALLQMALSRNREFDADLEAARLTGDPIGLALALEKLEFFQRRSWTRIFLPGRRLPDPSLLRSHPSTGARVRRLRELAEFPAQVQPLEARPPQLPEEWPVVIRRPRRHWHGIWH